jgi:hypothetical protein
VAKVNMAEPLWQKKTDVKTKKAKQKTKLAKQDNQIGRNSICHVITLRKTTLVPLLEKLFSNVVSGL